jgi:hypothetical protein
MTARETTLGALTAADLGSVILLDGREVGVAGVLHNEGGTVIFLDVPPWCLKTLPSTTPVTVYDEGEA